MEEADSQRDEGLSDTKDPASCLMMQAALGLMTFHFRPAGLMLTLEWSLYGCGRIDRKLATQQHTPPMKWPFCPPVLTSSPLQAVR